MYVNQAQFVSALVLGVRALIYGCDFPLWMQYALVLYMGSFLFLFGQYYRTAYLQKKQVYLNGTNTKVKTHFQIFYYRKQDEKTVGGLQFTRFYQIQLFFRTSN